MIGKTSDPTGDVPVPTVRVILRAVRAADTVSIAFPRLQRALVVDFRQGEGHQPAVLVADLGFTVEEQWAAVEKLRPGLAPIERFVATVWGGSTRAFAEQGVLPVILDRLPPQYTPEVMVAVEGLRAVERGLAPRRAQPEAAEGGDDHGG